MRTPPPARLAVAALASAVLALASHPAAGQGRPGEAPPDEVHPLLVPFAAQIDFCFQRERSLFPGAHGTVTVRATIDGNGHAAGAELEASSFDEPGSVVAACLLAAVGRWTFPTTPDVVGIEHHLSFLLRPSAPTRIADSPSEIDVTWHLRYRDGEGLLFDDRVADELLAEMDRARSEMRACIMAEPDARTAGGGMEVMIRVPGGGDIGLDDVEVAGGTYAAAHPLSRCVSRVATRFEARSSTIVRTYRWIVRWTVDTAPDD